MTWPRTMIHALTGSFISRRYASVGRMALNPATGRPGRFAMVRTSPDAGVAKKILRRTSETNRVRMPFMRGLLILLLQIVNFHQADAGWWIAIGVFPGSEP
jgi:hypothetical protein